MFILESENFLDSTPEIFVRVFFLNKNDDSLFIIISQPEPNNTQQNPLIQDFNSKSIIQFELSQNLENSSTFHFFKSFYKYSYLQSTSLSATKINSRVFEI